MKMWKAGDESALESLSAASSRVEGLRIVEAAISGDRFKSDGIRLAWINAEIQRLQAVTV
jgi:hypothetical protein